jgi:hypothetical protein
VSETAAPVRSHVAWWLLVLVGVGVAAWCAAGAGTRAANGGRLTADEPQYVLTAISLGEDFDLDISDERTEQRFRDFHRAALPVQEKLRDDGRLVSPHDPLLPLYLALPVLVGGWLGAKLALAALAGALAALLLWVAVVRFGIPLVAALVTVVAFSAGAPLAMYGTQIYPEIAAALVVTIATAALTGPLHRRALAVTGVCVVALPWLSVKYAPVAATLAAVAAWLWWRAGKARAVWWFVGGLALAGVAYFALHHAWYDGWTVYASGDHFAGGELTVVGYSPDYAGRAIRLVGLLLDRDFGLAAWHPLYLLALPALASFAVRRPERWPVLVAPLVAGWINATFVALTMHGWWWPGRQVVVVLPCVVLAVAWWASSNATVLRAIAVLGAIGAFVFLWLVLESSVGDLRLIVTFESTTNPLVRAWHTVLPDYRELRARDWILHGAWLVAIAATTLAVIRPRLAWPRPRTWNRPVTSPVGVKEMQ